MQGLGLIPRTRDRGNGEGGRTDPKDKGQEKWGGGEHQGRSQAENVSA